MSPGRTRPSVVAVANRCPPQPTVIVRGGMGIRTYRLDDVVLPRRKFWGATFWQVPTGQRKLRFRPIP